jgi:hypothetical protein
LPISELYYVSPSLKLPNCFLATGAGRTLILGFGTFLANNAAFSLAESSLGFCFGTEPD